MLLSVKEKQMSTSKRHYSSSVNHHDAVVKMLRENPSYAQLYRKRRLSTVWSRIQDPVT